MTDRTDDILPGKSAANVARKLKRENDALRAELASERAKLKSECEGCEKTARLEDEVALLRSIFPRILSALGNGAACTADVSVEFMEQIPDEIKTTIKQMRHEYKVALREGNKAITREAELEAEVVRLTRQSAGAFVAWLNSRPWTDRDIEDELSDFRAALDGEDHHG